MNAGPPRDRAAEPSARAAPPRERVAVGPAPPDTPVSREQHGVNFTAGAIRQLRRRLDALESEVRELRALRNNSDRRNDGVSPEVMNHGTFDRPR